jgi:hypothetical protein
VTWVGNQLLLTSGNLYVTIGIDVYYILIVGLIRKFLIGQLIKVIIYVKIGHSL